MLLEAFCVIGEVDVPASQVKVLRKIAPQIRVNFLEALLNELERALLSEADLGWVEQYLWNRYSFLIQAHLGVEEAHIQLVDCIPRAVDVEVRQDVVLLKLFLPLF